MISPAPIPIKAGGRKRRDSPRASGREARPRHRLPRRRGLPGRRGTGRQGLCALPDLLRSTQTLDEGCDRIALRHFAAGRECVAHLGRPGADEVCRVERTRGKAGRTSREIPCAAAQLSPEQTDPDAPLDLWRDHGLIEDRLRWRRGVNPREDNSPVRVRHKPRAMAEPSDALPDVVRDAAERITVTP